jgi:hypothetical protein
MTLNYEGKVLFGMTSNYEVVQESKITLNNAVKVYSKMRAYYAVEEQSEIIIKYAAVKV